MKSKTDLFILFISSSIHSFLKSELYLEPSQTSTMDPFAKILKVFLLLTMFAKGFHLRCLTQF